MSTSQYVGVRTGDLGKLGNELRTSGGDVTGSAKRVSDNTFGNGKTGSEPDAGRAYTAEGAKIHAGLEVICTWLKTWGAAGTALADAMGAATVEYSNTDEANKNKMNNA